MTILMLGRIYKKPEKECGFLVHFDNKTGKGYIEEYVEGKWFDKALKLKKKIKEFEKEEMFIMLQNYLEQKNNLEALLIDNKEFQTFDNLEKAFIREMLKETITHQKFIKELVDKALNFILSKEIDTKLNQIVKKLQDRDVINKFSLQDAKKTLKYQELANSLVERYKKQFPEDYNHKLKLVASRVLETILKKEFKQEMAIPLKTLVKKIKPRILTELKALALDSIQYFKQEGKFNLKIPNREIQEILEEMYNTSFEHLLGASEEKIAKAFAKIDRSHTYETSQKSREYKTLISKNQTHKRKMK